MDDRTNEANGEHVEAVVRQRFNDVKANTHITRDVQYVLNFRPIDGHNTLGKYKPEKVKLVDKLPPSATLSQRSINEGWVYDASTHTASWEGSLPLVDEHSQRRMSKKIWLNYANHPMYLNQIGQRNVPDEYVFKNKADFWINPGTQSEQQLPERFANGIFEAYETTTPPFGKKESFQFDAWGSTDNSRFQNFYDKINDDLTKPQDNQTKTVHFNSRVSQTNNGSSYEDISGGYTRDVKKISWDLDEKLYFKHVRVGTGETHSNITDIANSVPADTKRAKVEELRTQYTNIGKKLYGITRDGEKELITDSLPLDTNFDIDNEKYKSLTLEFDEPLVMDNAQFYFRMETYPTAEEKAKFRDGTYKTDQQYFLWMNIDAKRSDEAEYTHFPKTREHHTHQNYSYVRIPDPKIEFYDVGGDHTVPYGENNVRRVTVGSRLTGNWTGIEQRQKVQQVTLLPSGIVFKEHIAIRGADPKYRNIHPTIVENYRGTGKTAVIYEYELNRDGSENYYLRADFDVDTTIYANAGANVFEHFIVWPDNDVVKPAGSQYKDALDLDGDGDTNEVFMRRTTTINFIPPLEVISKKTVALTPVVGGLVAPPQDIGESLYFHINILNNSIKGLTTLSIIDVLPYVGDHKIAPNDRGEYLPRNSQFAMTLTDSIESVAQNAKVLERFDVFYSTTQQGADLASVRDANWVTKDEIADFTQVKNVKFVLKEGAVLKSEEEVGFFLPSAIPYDESLPSGSVAKNSLAFSTNNYDYIEANEAVASNIKYTLSGTVFFDYNRQDDNHGKINDDDPKLQGYVAKLMNEDGTEYLDYHGRPVTAVTDRNGQYSMNVYKRGNYYVQFTKREADEQFTVLYSKVGTIGNDTTQDENNDLKGKSAVFALNPITPHAVRNAGILATKGSVTINKTDEDGNPLRGVIFKLENPEVVDKAEVDMLRTTDENGQVVFSDLPFATYNLTEVKTLEGYVKDQGTQIINLNDNNAIVTIDRVNNRIKGRVELEKVNVDNTDEKLQGVVFELRQGDEVRYTSTSNELGKVLFENVVYGTYKLYEKSNPIVGYEAIDNTGKLITYTVDNEEKSDVTISENGQIIDIGQVTNEKIKGRISITKVDADDQNVKLKGVVFSLKQGDNEIATAETNEDGVAVFTDVPHGVYTIVEKTTLINYDLSDRVENVSIETQGQEVNINNWTNQIKKGTVTIKKVDKENPDIVLEGVTFVLEQNGIEKYRAVTDRNGIATFNNVVYGEYTSREIATLVNYNLEPNVRNVSITSTGQNVELERAENTLKKGSVVLTKVDKEDNTKLLQNVVFVLKQGDVEKYTATTDVNGIARFENVVYGEYVLEEKTPLENYNAYKGSFPVNIDSHGKVVDIGLVTNQIKKGNVSFIKVDAEDNTKKLSGVTFVLKQNNVEKYRAVTNEEGKALFTAVVYGDYVLEEIDTLENYILSTEKRNVSVREEGATVELDNFTNQIKKGNVTLEKVDKDNNEEKLEGIKFVLIQNGVEKYTATTDSKGKLTFSNVIYGNYELYEKETLVNYVKLEGKIRDVFVRENGQTIDLGQIENEKIKSDVQILKVDKENPDKKLQGVTFELRQDGVTKYTAITNENGIATFKNVIYGDYELIEVATLVNYNLEENRREISIRNNGAVVETERAENTIKKGSIIFTKVDLATKEKLAGVEFELRQNDNVIMKSTSNNEGVVEFIDVIYGDYTIVETKEKPGYRLLDKAIPVSILENGKVYDLGNIENERIPTQNGNFKNIPKKPEPQPQPVPTPIQVPEPVPPAKEVVEKKENKPIKKRVKKGKVSPKTGDEIVSLTFNVGVLVFALGTVLYLRRKKKSI